jgi:hypothetical protein
MNSAAHPTRTASCLTNTRAGFTIDIVFIEYSNSFPHSQHTL